MSALQRHRIGFQQLATRALQASSILALLAFAAAPARAAWSTDSLANTLICGAAGGQGYSTACPDGLGGVILAWTDGQAGGGVIHLDRLTPNGDPAWTSCGVPVAHSPTYQFFSALVPDGLGGAMVFWEDFYTEVVYGQHVSASGLLLWGDGGVPIVAGPGPCRRPTAAPDGQGGALVAWSDSRTGTPAIRMQHVLPSGALVLASAGVVLSDTVVAQVRPSLCKDGSGGAIVAWIEGQSTANSQVICLRVSGSGQSLWAQRQSVRNARGTDAAVAVVDAGSGESLIVFTDSTVAGSHDLVVKGYDGNGAMRFAGVDVVPSGAHYPVSPVATSDEQRGAYVAWEDGSGGNVDIFMMRVDFFGQAAPAGWPVGGRRVTFNPSVQSWPAITTDLTGAAVVAWTDYRNGDGSMFGQRVRRDGSIGGALFSIGSPVPAIAAIGAQVLIPGSNVPVDATPYFGRQAATASNTASQLTAQVPVGAHSGRITVVSPGSGAATSITMFGVSRSATLASLQGSAPGRPWFASFTPMTSPLLGGTLRSSFSQLGLGAADPLSWRAFHWSTATARYQEVGVDIDSLESGLGYWIERKEGGAVELSGVEIPWADIRIALPNTVADIGAWHQLGNPFSSSIAGWQLQFERDGIVRPLLSSLNTSTDDALWRWSEATQSYQTVTALDTIRPGESFWIHVAAGQGGGSTVNALWIATPGARVVSPSPLSASTTVAGGWQIDAIARQGGMESSRLTLGVGAPSSSNWNVRHLPPMPNPRALRLVSEAAEADERIQDIRADGAPRSWTLVLSGGEVPGTTLLSIETPSGAPPRLALRDAAGKLIGVVAGRGTWSLPASSDPIRLTLAPLESDALAEAPNFLAYPYPNPSVGPVGFVLPAGAGSRLRCDVLDAAGRCVRTLEGVATAAGQTTLVWDGRGRDGRLTTPGIYWGRWRNENTGAIGTLRVVRLSGH